MPASTKLTFARKQNEINRSNRDDHDWPKPRASSLAQDDPGKNYRDQRLRLLQHVGLGKQLVLGGQLEGLGEEQGRDRLRPDRDQGNSNPAGQRQPAHLLPTQNQKGQHAERDQQVFGDDDLRGGQMDEMTSEINVRG